MQMRASYKSKLDELRIRLMIYDVTQSHDRPQRLQFYNSKSTDPLTAHPPSKYALLPTSILM